MNGKAPDECSPSHADISLQLSLDEHGVRLVVGEVSAAIPEARLPRTFPLEIEQAFRNTYAAKAGVQFRGFGIND